MQVYNAWDYTLGDPSIVIAHLDTGIGLNQADCPLSIVHPQNFFHFPPDTNVQDVYDHGSGTSAIMVAATNNGTGMAGIARNCSLMPIVVDWDNGFQDNDFLVDGLMWAANNGAHVINMSYESLTFDIFSEPAAIQYAYAAGCTLVVSAGNDGFSHLPYPAVYPQCIPVTSVNQAAGFSGFNNYSTAVQLCGPGEGIYTMTLWNNGYSSENGTSYSAPMVSAVAGLVKSVNPALTNVQVLNCLLAGADAVPYDSRVPSMVGRVNALGAVKAAKATTASTGKSQVGYR